jgi:class 3 adenylate cyclase/tetratricopeptide (TPR) repeat protein
LPADLALRLDTALASDGSPHADVGLLVAVRDALDELREDLGTYLPRPLIRSNPAPGVPRAEFLEGTILFVDVSGFTPLAEQLRTVGEEGAERLNRMINALFTAMLEPLSRWGGELLIFAGDAIQAYFPAAGAAQDAVQATQAALHMSRAITPFARGPMPLSVNAGLARGRFFTAQIGTTERMEYLVTGGPIQGAMQAEKRATAHRVVVTPGLAPALASHFDLVPIGDGYAAVVDARGDSPDVAAPQSRVTRAEAGTTLAPPRDPQQLIAQIRAALAVIEALAPFFPPNVLRRIVAHQREGQFPGEHRLVAVMFVNLRGFEALIDAWPAQELDRLLLWLTRYFTTAQETLSGCGGLVTQLDAYETGFTLLCPFGAPMADEETPQRATAAALRLNEQLRALNQDLAAARHRGCAAGMPALTHHIGISYGPIYTGQVGWQERREYVVVGDDVNLAARLMSNSRPNQILISGWVHDRVRPSFECRPLEPMALKGKSKPVRVYAVERRVRASAWLREAAVGSLVGREPELRLLEGRLDELEGGRGGALALISETGMGKTRLIAELALRSRYWDILLLAGRCLSYAQHTPYTPWVESLWRWFELDTTEGAARRARVVQALGQLGLADLEETLAALLGLPAVDAGGASLPTRHLLEERPGPGGLLQEPAARPQRALEDLPSLWEELEHRVHPEEALPRLLQESARQEKPILFIVEDLQWADRASWTLLANLARATARHPILLIVTIRSGPAARRWETETGTATITLQGLSGDETGKLAARLIRAREAAPELIAWLHARTQGNPLFASQLLYALAGAEGLRTDPQTGQVTLSKTLPSLPASVREIMLSRVDQLAEEGRTVVKLAAVIGDTVPSELLTHLALRVTGANGERLDAALRELADRSLLAPAPPATEFAFVHPLLQEAVYSSIPYAQRRRWHRIIADYLCQGDAESVRQHLDALAYHYRHSDEPGRGAHYQRLAGYQATARQAWDEALAYYQEAIEIAGEDGASQAERSRSQEGVGDVYVLTGRYAQAALAYRRALAGAPQPAQVEGKLGLIAPLLDGLETEIGTEIGMAQAVPYLTRAWSGLGPDAPLRPWMAAALGWHALRGRTLDRAGVAGAGATAVGWWGRGQRIAHSETARVALNEMMAGRVPADYAHLVRLALQDYADYTIGEIE